jgi:hypothetical protein
MRNTKMSFVREDISRLPFCSQISSWIVLQTVSHATSRATGQMFRLLGSPSQEVHTKASTPSDHASCSMN